MQSISFLIPGLKGKVEELNNTSKEYEKKILSFLWICRTLEHHEQSKCLNYRHRYGRGIPGQWYRTDLHQDHIWKLPAIMKRYNHTEHQIHKTRKEIPQWHIWNTNYTENQQKEHQTELKNWCCLLITNDF